MNNSPTESTDETRMSVADREDLYAKAQIRWTHEAQLAKAAEEFAELAAVVSRWQNDQTTAEEILDEMADAKIMLEQLETVFTDEAVDTAFNRKLTELKNRLQYDVEVSEA
ncbi:MAG: hypothetical protein ACLFR6_06320 [Salinarchaeum sp.]